MRELWFMAGDCFHFDLLSQAQLQNNARQVKTFSCHYHNWNTTAASNAMLHSSHQKDEGVQGIMFRQRTEPQLENSWLSKFKVALWPIMIWIRVSWRPSLSGDNLWWWIWVMSQHLSSSSLASRVWSWNKNLQVTCGNIFTGRYCVYFASYIFCI